MRKARRVTLHKYPAIHHSDEDSVVRIKADAPVLLPDEPVPALISLRKSVNSGSFIKKTKVARLQDAAPH